MRQFKIFNSLKYILILMAQTNINFSSPADIKNQEIIDQLLNFTEETETQLNNDIQTQVDESENS